MGANIPLPALGLRPSEPVDFLSNYQKTASLKSLLQGQQLQQQQIVAGQQENEMRGMQLRDQQILRQSANNVDWKQSDAFDRFMGNAQQQGVSPQTLSQLAMQRQQYLKQVAETDEATNKATQSSNNIVLGHIDSLTGIQDPQQRAQAAQMQGQRLLSGGLRLDPQTQAFAQKMAAGGYAPSDDDLKLFESGLLDHNTVIDNALKQSQTASNRYKVVNGMLMDVSGAQPAPAMSGQMNPQQWGALVDNVVPPTPANQRLNARTHASVSFFVGQGNLEAAQKALSEAGTQLGTVENQTNPEVQAGKVKVAAAEGAARANVEAQAARGSNAALAEVPPHLIAPATAAAEKAGTDYAQALSVTQRLNAMMAAAKSGNVVSYQLIPQEGALQLTTSQGVHRINMAEIQNYGGGSLWQRMQGHFGKALTGQSIPASVLNDMAEMQQIQAQGAQTKYQNSLKTINQMYGSKFQPVQMDNGSQGAGNGGDFFSKFGGKAR